ncbi:MAG: hypothetical protein AAB019_11975 [Planctomycetota bacterium]
MRKILIVLLMVSFASTGLLMSQDEFKPNFDFKGSRFAAGYLDSQTDGAFHKGSYQVPDTKLRFNWNIIPDATIVTRMSLNDSTFKEIDYLYIDYKDLFVNLSPSVKDSFFNPKVRMGRFKLETGEETWSNNGVESVVISNSASNFNATDEGIQFSGTVKKEQLGIPMKWSLSFTNANSGTGKDDEQGKAICFKIAANPVPELYASATYFNSYDIGANDAEASYAGLKTRPTNATVWTRKITEINLRYDFQPGKEDRLNPGAPAWSDSKGFIRVAYGNFVDNGDDEVAPILVVTKRDGKYYFIEGCYNATEKVYLAARQSNIAFDDSDMFASLNGVNANEYTRTSLGVGYRLSDKTHIKVESMSNSEDVPTGTDEPDNNQFSLLITAKF